MPVYRIDRPVGGMSDAEMDAAALRAVACMPNFAGMTWLRSYHNATTGHLTCYYEAQREEDIWEHARYAHIPCEQVTEVTEILPSRYR
jgi:hypothetical protein